MSDAAHVDPDAVVRLGADLNSYTRVGDEVRAAAASAAASVLRHIDAELDRRRLELQRAEDAYAACMRGEDADCSVERRQVNRAQVRLTVAQGCLQRFRVAKEQYDQDSARYRSAVSHVNDQAQRRLAQIATDLGIYQQFALHTSPGGGHTVAFGGGGRHTSSGASTGGGWSVGTGGPGQSTGDIVYRPPGIPDGYSLVPLALIDDSDSRVGGPEDFKMDCSPEDLEWGFTALQQVVLPALARGKSLDYFRDRDTRDGLMGNRSYSDTYTGFFGASEAPRFTRQVNGTFRIANGFHRVWVARRLGLDSVPGQVVD